MSQATITENDIRKADDDFRKSSVLPPPPGRKVRKPGAPPETVFVDVARTRAYLKGLELLYEGKKTVAFPPGVEAPAEFYEDLDKRIKRIVDDYVKAALVRAGVAVIEAEEAGNPIDPAEVHISIYV